MAATTDSFGTRVFRRPGKGRTVASRNGPGWTFLSRNRAARRQYAFWLLLALFTFVSWIPAKPVEAHSGGLNASGCHNNRRTGDYHCHRGSSAPAPRPQPVYTPPRATTGRYFRNCAEVRAEELAPLYEGDDGYRPGLDGDRDGIACEYSSAASGPVSRERSPGLGYGVAAISPGTATATTDRPPIMGEAVATDGDTLVINDQRIRLWGVDAFEAEQRCSGANGGEWGCGGVATRAVQEIVEDTQTICIAKDTDTYGRIVAICRANGVDIAAAIVVRGLGVAYTRYSNDYVPEEQLARSQKAGAWEGAFTAPEEFRRSRQGSSVAIAARNATAPGECVIKGNVNSRGTKRYFLRGDNNYDQVRAEAVFCGEDEALAAGFERATN